MEGSQGRPNRADEEKGSRLAQGEVVTAPLPERRLRTYDVCVAYPVNNIFHEDTFVARVRAKDRKDATRKAIAKWGAGYVRFVSRSHRIYARKG